MLRDDSVRSLLSDNTDAPVDSLFTSFTVPLDRQVVFTKTGMPFIIAGSGTLGWDQVGPSAIMTTRVLSTFPL